ncbi:MAG: ribosomal RNA small subunit methyltransferase A [Proteobacteria bacterium]|nr:MAG: ribosomal RNA small subunit methyltransferase A [Pseudomonadota bacterium]
MHGRSSIRSKLQELEHRPSKQRGQNFVVNPRVLEAIIEFGAPKQGERLVEVGPGLGALTEKLLTFGPLTAIEIEQSFCDELRSKFPELEVILHDVRTFDFASLGRDLVVFGNLPYIYSTDIIFHLLSSRASLKRAVLLLQREFAERLAAGPGGREYGRISVACQVYCDLRLGPVISGEAFFPRPKVESRLIEIVFLPQPRHEVEDHKWLERVVKASFAKRRKKLVNSLKASGLFSGEHAAKALEASAIDPGRRAETLRLEEFVRLAKELARFSKPAGNT